MADLSVKSAASGHLEKLSVTVMIYLFPFEVSSKGPNKVNLIFFNKVGLSALLKLCGMAMKWDGNNEM